MTPLEDLYNAIEQDYSVQRYTLGWSDVMELIKKRSGFILKTKRELNQQVIADALNFCDGKRTYGKIKSAIEAFTRELNMNLETYNKK